MKSRQKNNKEDSQAEKQQKGQADRKTAKKIGRQRYNSEEKQIEIQQKGQADRDTTEKIKSGHSKLK